mmetsp:Transcript_36741/g.103672  ORF Transcript_36741/g.103672 Transcript_36741/m.103672 type:complete len:323 (-) Transcript_36741:1405-2373(-)
MEAQTPRIMLGCTSQWVYVSEYASPWLARAAATSDTIIAIMVVSSSSVSTYSMQPEVSRSGHSISSHCSARIWLFLIFRVWSSTMNSGRQHRPKSVYSRSSFIQLSNTTLTSFSMSPCRRSCRSVLTSFGASLLMPYHTPLTKILVLFAMTLGLISSSISVVHSSRKSMRGPLGEPTLIMHISARFFTSPQACPSGVSAGHTIPHWLLCNCLGLASLPSRPMGELMRRRWLRLELYVSRLSTWLTPARLPAWPCCPQFPVASEYLRPLVSVCGFMLMARLISRLLSTQYLTYLRTSLVSCRKSMRKRPASSGPPRSMRLLAK